MAIRQVSDGNPDGTILGQNASDKISFYGATPVVQPVVPNAATAQQIVDALRVLGLVAPAV